MGYCVHVRDHPVGRCLYPVYPESFLNPRKVDTQFREEYSFGETGMSVSTQKKPRSYLRGLAQIHRVGLEPTTR